MSDFWGELEGEVLGCLARGSMEPSEIGRRLALSEDAVVSLVTMLAQEGKVRIRLVEGVDRRSLAA